MGMNRGSATITADIVGLGLAPTVFPVDSACAAGASPCPTTMSHISQKTSNKKPRKQRPGKPFPKLPKLILSHCCATIVFVTYASGYFAGFPALRQYLCD